MMLSQSQSYVCCIQKHIANKLCLLPSCTFSSPMCCNDQCSCNKIHKKCMFSTSIQDILDNMIDKSQALQRLDQDIINYYDELIKHIQIDKQSFLQTISQQGLRLKGDEKRLEILLKQNNPSMILPELVNKVVTSLRKDDTVDELKKEVMYKILTNKKIIDEAIDSIKIIWERIIWKQKQIQNKSNIKVQKVEYYFSQDLCHKQIQVISNRIIKKTANSGFYRFAMIQPALNKQSSSVLLKINNTRSNVYLGAGRITSLKNSRFQYPKNSQGLHIVRSSDGWTVNCQEKRQHLRTSDFICSSGDLIKLTRQGNHIKFLNTKTKIQISLEVSKYNNDLIYFCVGLNSEEDQVEIIEPGKSSEIK